MKSFLNLTQVVCVAVTLSLFGCKSNEGHDKANSAATAMEGMGGVVTTAKDSTLAVGKSLKAMVASAKTDPVTAFTQLKTDIAAMKSAREALYSRDDAFKAQGASYLTDWEKSNATITDPDLKKIGDERRATLQEVLASVDKPMAEVRTSLDPFVASCEDLQKFLANDLTPASIGAVEDKAKSGAKQSAKIADTLGDLESALAKAAPKFKVAKPPPPAK
jgi:hypothetical protein